MNTKNRESITLVLVVLGLAGILSSHMFPVEEPPVVNAASARHTLTIDVAADCRTFVPGTNRGDDNTVSGKIFPGGTLPIGSAGNDPTLPVNGVAPIGEWLNRTRQTVPFPPAIASAYSSVPPTFGNFYYLFNDGRALTTDGYGAIVVNGTPVVPFAVTGGIGGLSGAAGDGLGTILGTNATGCPNARIQFNIQPGSVRGGLNN
jgi:hypothetical protein